MHSIIPRFLLAQRFSCSFFVRPKKELKKGRRKEQLRPFWAPAAQGLDGTTKKAKVHALSGSPPHRYLKHLLYNYCTLIILINTRIN
jgi:hypothetical protein